MTDLEIAQDLLRRKPRLAAVLIAVHEMIEGRRNCRISLDIAGGVIRLFRESQERSISLADLAPRVPPIPGP